MTMPTPADNFAAAHAAEQNSHSPAGQVDHLPAVTLDPPATMAEAEVGAEEMADPEGSVRVHLGPEDGGLTILVPDRRQWRSSALTALNRMDFQAWADWTLLEGDAEAVEDYDPTLAEIEEFLNVRLPAAFGDDPKSRARSNRGSRRARRR